MTRTKRFLSVVALGVLLVHLALLGLLEILLAGPLPSKAPQELVSVQLLAPPKPSAPALPRLDAPRPPAEAIEQQAQAAPDPIIQPSIEQPPIEQARIEQPQVDSVALSAQPLPVEEFFESSLEPSALAADPSEVVGSGAVAMTAYWGDFSSGSPIGHSRIELAFPEPGRYAIKMVTEAAGWARLFASAPMLAEAQGRLGPEGFMPERYAHQGPRRSEVTVFDYEKQEVRYESIKDPFPLLKGVQDRLTFMIQLGWMLQENPEQFSLGQTVRLPIAGRNKLEDVDFVVLSDADLALPGGLLVPALHLSSNRQTNRYSVQIDVWMDKTDRLLPVRIRFEEARGTVLDLLTVRN